MKIVGHGKIADASVEVYTIKGEMIGTLELESDGGDASTSIPEEWELEPGFYVVRATEGELRARFVVIP